jgi:hypothetical protein
MCGIFEKAKINRMGIRTIITTEGGTLEMWVKLQNCSQAALTCLNV